MKGARRFVLESVLAFGALVLAGSGIPAIAQEAETWPPLGVSFNGDPSVPDISGLW